MQTTVSEASPAGTAARMMPFTIAHLILIAILAVVAILIIWWGVKLHRKRKRAETALEHNREIDRTDPDTAVSANELEQLHRVRDQADEPDETERASSISQPTARMPEHETPPANHEPAPPVQAQTPPTSAQPVTPPPPPPIVEPDLSAIEPVPAAVPHAAADDALTTLKGLGPKCAARMNELGINGYRELAKLTPEDAAALDQKLGAFQGRMARDRWLEQARLLSADDRAGYEATFGKLG